ncbi:MAG: AarF/ABC1/UbiB kinase family protein [Pirellulaceae bacterium]|nr:AarF/ABC1/UbiB kinase family protein [Pirellulaceae bacterium]
MKITSIPQLYRNLRRWQDILAVLRKYGLADWLSQLKFDFIRDWIKDDQGVPLSSYSREQRIRLALTDLGPTFIKLGQVLSLRPDLIGPSLATELTQLQANVPADPGQTIKELIERELGQPVDQLFVEFHDRAIASASIGQVHRARLPDGTEVVVKVQHANIERTVNEDLEIMAGLATLAEHIPEFAVWKPKVIVEQLSRSLRRELNFSRELQHLIVFRKQYGHLETVRIPAAFPKLSSPRVLTMEYIAGVPVSALADKQADVDSSREQARQTLAKIAADLYVEMIFIHGFYHADPHPGNILVLDGNKLGLLDFGMVGRIDDRLRETIEEMLLAVISQDTGVLTSLIKRVGNNPPRLDEAALAIDVADLVANYGSQPLESFDLSGALNDVTDIMYNHQISLPPQTSLLIKMLVTLEGTLHQLSPKLSLIEVMQPFFRRMWLRRLSPKRQVKRLNRIYVELESMLEKLPSQVSSIMQLVQEGRLDVHLAHKGLSPSTNRLVMGMLVSSVFMGSSLLLSFKVPPLLFSGDWWGLQDLSLLGLIGYAFSMLAGLRLIRAIQLSGNLDRDTD